MKNDSPLVSLIVPVRNAEATIGKCLDSLLALDYPERDREIIVVNDGSNDRTPDILKKYRDRLTVLETPGLGPSVARNLGVRQARGKYVAFTDADCIVDRDWISHLLLGFPGREAAGVGGDQKSPADETPFGRLVMDFFKSLGFLGGYTKSSAISGIREVSHNPSCNVIYKKEIIEKLGGFQPGLWPGEDVDLDYRIRKSGFSLFYAPAALAYHYQPADLRRFIRKMYSYGQWSGGFLTRKYGLFRKLSYVPFLLAGLLLLEIAAFILCPLLAWLLLGAGFLFPPLYFLIITRDFKKAPVLWLLFFSTLIFWDLGFLRGLNERLPS